MGIREILRGTLNLFADISNEFGTGDWRNDLALVVILLVIFFLILVFRVLLKYSRAGGAAGAAGLTPSSSGNPNFDYVRGIVGRLEKIDATLNSFKTDSLRWSQLHTNDLVHVKHQLGEIRKHLTGEAGYSLDDAEAEIDIGMSRPPALDDISVTSSEEDLSEELKKK